MYGTGTGGNASCANRPIIVSTCKANPFSHPGCRTADDIDDYDADYCMDNLASPLADCPSIINTYCTDNGDHNLCNITITDWLSSFRVKVPTKPGARSGLLHGNRTTVSTSGHKDTGIIVHHLNLSTATYNGHALGGDIYNGLAFYDGTVRGRTYFYSGILSDTNLGKPLTQATGTAEWRGQLAAAHGIHGDLILRDMTLEIDFATKRLEAFVHHSGQAYYHLFGAYEPSGVFKGNINYGDYSDIAERTPTNNRPINGSITGIIGQKGAVGTIVSWPIGIWGFSGGFVACPYDEVNNRCERE